MKLSTMQNLTEATKSEVNALEGLATLITEHDWAPGIFSNSYRKKENFISAEIVALDVDDGCTLEEAKTLFAEHKHIIATTRNHQKIKNNGKLPKPACDRFRVLLFLEKPIETIENYENLMKALMQKYSFIDPATKDCSRFYYKCVQIFSINNTGKFLSETYTKLETKKAKSPGRKTNLSEFTLNFLKEGVEAGMWNNSLYKVAKDLQSNNYSFDDAIQLLESMRNQYFSGQLDLVDLNTIESAFRSEPWQNNNWSKTTKLSKTDPDLLKDLLFKSGYSVRYNEMKSHIQINGEKLSDAMVSEIRNLARRNGISANSDYVLDVLREMSLDNAYHPFKEALEKLEATNCEGYIDKLISTIKFSESKSAYHDHYKKMIKKWFLGVVNKVYHSKDSQNFVLVFLGKQGCGKSRWIGRLNFIEGMYGEGLIHPEDKDHRLRHLRYLIWHVAELDGVTTKKEASALKDYFTKTSVNDRPPYALCDIEGYSSLSFIASVNESTFLRDPTGNRRFVVIEVESMDAAHLISIDKVFAEAYANLARNEVSWLTNEDISLNEENNKEHLVEDKITYIANQLQPGSARKTLHEIFIHFSHLHPNQGEYTKLGSLLLKKGIQRGTRSSSNANKTYLVNI